MSDTDLRAAIERLPEKWECSPPGQAPTQYLHREVCVACSHADQLRRALAAHPAPDEASEHCCEHDGDAHDGSGCLDCSCPLGPPHVGYNPTPAPESAEADRLRDRLRKDAEAQAKRPAHERRYMPAIAADTAPAVPADGECSECGSQMQWKFNGGNLLWICYPCADNAPADGARDAGRLTEGDREALHEANSYGGGWKLDAAVESILAARLAAVTAERDQLRADLDREFTRANNLRDSVVEASNDLRDCGEQLDRMGDKALDAEAERDEAQMERADLLIEVTSLREQVAGWQRTSSV